MTREIPTFGAWNPPETAEQRRARAEREWAECDEADCSCSFVGDQADASGCDLHDPNSTWRRKEAFNVAAREAAELWRMEAARDEGKGRRYRKVA